MTLLQRMLPDGARVTPQELMAELRERESVPEDRPRVLMVMVAGVDARTTLGGSSRALGGPADLALLLELRTIADAVLVGGATVRAEGYARLVGAPDRRERRRRGGLAEDPPAVLVSRSMDLPWDAGLFAAPEQPVLVYTGRETPPPPAVSAPVEVVRLPEPTLAAALADLRRRGVSFLLCEGGPSLNGALLAAGLVDELFLTVSPVLTGDDAARTIVNGALPGPLDLELRWVCEADGELYLRYTL